MHARGTNQDFWQVSALNSKPDISRDSIKALWRRVGNPASSTFSSFRRVKAPVPRVTCGGGIAGPNGYTRVVSIDIQGLAMHRGGVVRTRRIGTFCRYLTHCIGPRDGGGDTTYRQK